MNKMFDRVGYIINRYLPELYMLDIFIEIQIIEIINNNILTSD